jgi:hypothetical protein
MKVDNEFAEFDCCECGRHILVVCGPISAPLCAACLMLPGWYRDAALRNLIDPGHDGEEQPLHKDGWQ